MTIIRHNSSSKAFRFELRSLKKVGFHSRASTVVRYVVCLLCPTESVIKKKTKQKKQTKKSVHDDVFRKRIPSLQLLQQENEQHWSIWLMATAPSDVLKQFVSNHVFAKHISKLMCMLIYVLFSCRRW